MVSPIGNCRFFQWLHCVIVVYQNGSSHISGGAKGGATGSDVTGSHVTGSGPDRQWWRAHAQPVPALFSYYSSSTKCTIAHDRDGYRISHGTGSHVTGSSLGVLSRTSGFYNHIILYELVLLLKLIISVIFFHSVSEFTLSKTFMCKMIAFIMVRMNKSKILSHLQFKKTGLFLSLNGYFMSFWRIWYITYIINKLTLYFIWECTCIWFINFWFPRYFLCNLKFLSSWHI